MNRPGQLGRKAGPLLVFLALGGGLFVLTRLLGGAQAVASARIEVTSFEIEALRARFQQQHGRTPSRSEEAIAVERLVREAILVEEARRRGLHHADLVVRRRLLEKMALLAPDAPAGIEDRYREALDLGLDRDDVIVRRRLAQQMERFAVIEEGPIRIEPAAERAYYEQHRERFTVPPRYSFQHVFVRRGDASSRDRADRRRAARLLESLQASTAGAGPEDPLGDAFPLGTVIAARSFDKIAAEFGIGFAEDVVAAPVGRWHGPIASSFGWHLIRVEDVKPMTVRPFDDTRIEIRHVLRAEAEQRRVEQLIDGLRASSQIDIQWPISETAS